MSDETKKSEGNGVHSLALRAIEHLSQDGFNGHDNIRKIGALFAGLDLDAADELTADLLVLAEAIVGQDPKLAAEHIDHLHAITPHLKILRTIDVLDAMLKKELEEITEKEVAHANGNDRA